MGDRNYELAVWTDDPLEQSDAATLPQAPRSGAV